jgi:hypothetical protein
LQEYIEIVRKEREKITGDAEDKASPKVIVEEIERKGRDKYINARGNIDPNLVQYYYECSQTIARQVALKLNSTA